MIGDMYVFWKAMHLGKKRPTLFMFFSSNTYSSIYLFVGLSCTITEGFVCHPEKRVCHKQGWDTGCYLPPLNTAWLSVYLCVARRDDDKRFPSFFGAQAVAVAFQTNQSSLYWGVSPIRQAHRLPCRACLHTVLTLKSWRSLSEPSSIKKVTKYFYLYR